MRIKKKTEQSKQTNKKNPVWEKEEGKLNAVISFVNGVNEYSREKKNKDICKKRKDGFSSQSLL